MWYSGDESMRSMVSLWSQAGAFVTHEISVPFYLHHQHRLASSTVLSVAVSGGDTASALRERVTVTSEDVGVNDSFCECLTPKSGAPKRPHKFAYNLTAQGLC